MTFVVCMVHGDRLWLMWEGAAGTSMKWFTGVGSDREHLLKDMCAVKKSEGHLLAS